VSGEKSPREKRRRLRDYRCSDGSWRPPRAEGLARVLAKAGYGARPRTEALVRAGRIAVDGQVELDPSRPVERAHELCLDGALLREAPRRYLLLHKPAGVECQERAHAGSWVGDYLPDDAVGLEPAGRLDARARGLLLFSNDLGWNDEISSDRSLERRYEIVVRGAVSSMVLDVVRAGVSLPGQGVFRPQRVELLVAEEDRSTLRLHVRGGHHRQVRAVFTVLRHDVLSIVRWGLGAVDLATTPPGAWRDLDPEEIRQLATPCRRS
jgi:23S rRNA pseudouridine2605 synthase